MSVSEPLVWSSDIEEEAKENMALNAKILQCHRKIACWNKRKQKLEQKLKDKQVRVSLQSQGKKAWDDLSVKKKWKKDNLLILLQSEHERPASLKEECWEANVPETLRNDRELLLARLGRKDFGWYYAHGGDGSHFVLPSCFRGDKKVLIQTILQYPAILEQDDVITPALLCDTEIFRAVLRGRFKRNLKHYVSKFSSEIRSNPDLMLDALLINDSIIDVVDKSLRNNREFALRVAKELSSLGPKTLKYFSRQLRADREVVLAFVKLQGRSLMHASDPLRRDMEVVRAACQQSPTAFDNALGETKKELASDKAFLLDILHRSYVEEEPAEKLYKVCAPELQGDRKILASALANCLLKSSELPSELKSQRKFWMDAIEKYPSIWAALPGNYAHDPAFASLALAGIAEPSLASGEAWEIISLIHAHFLHLLDMDWGVCKSLLDKFGAVEDILDLVPRAMLSDKNAVLDACRINGGIYERVRTPLDEDRDVVKAALTTSPSTLWNIPPFVQHLYPDLVAQAIRGMSLSDPWEFFHAVDRDLWANRDVMLAWASRGGGFVDEDLIDDFEDDEELFLLFAEHKPDEFEHASWELRSDREFMLRVVEKNGTLLRYASEDVKEDFDVALLAFAETYDTACYLDATDSDDFRILTNFAEKVRERIEGHELYMKLILCGVSLSSGPECCLQQLDQGQETSLAYKRLIADYLDVSVGKELRMLRQASTNLAQWGY